MQQQFFIKKDSVLPYLRMELIKDGRGDFHRLWDCIQNSTVTFTMTDIENGVIKIANAPCEIIPREEEGCVTEYVIVYKWQPRDTKTQGTYQGEFKITFGDDLTSEEDVYPTGDLIMPIREDLIINIK